MHLLTLVSIFLPAAVCYWANIPITTLMKIDAFLSGHQRHRHNIIKCVHSWKPTNTKSDSLWGNCLSPSKTWLLVESLQQTSRTAFSSNVINIHNTSSIFISLFNVIIMWLFSKRKVKLDKPHRFSGGNVCDCGDQFSKQIKTTSWLLYSVRRC